MKTKLLLFSMVLGVSSFGTASAGNPLISEEFSSPAWQTELAALNPGTAVNPNAPTAVAYVSPVIVAPATSAGYGTLNSTDLYFGKYKLVGSIECLPELPCAVNSGTTHSSTTGSSLAFRLANNATGMMEFPVIASAGIITLHIRGGNATNVTNIGLEQFVNDVWVPVYTFPLNKTTTDLAALGVRDEVLTYDIASSGPIKLRLINNTSATKRYINLYHVDIAAYSPTDVKTIQKSEPFKVVGRRIVASQPTEIALFNVLGKLVYQNSIIDEIELPASLDRGVYLVKSEQGSQKIVLK